MCDAEEVKFALKVTINKEKTKVLFAEADSHFADVLLSFLTLPLGKIVGILEKHYGDETPIIGSLNTLYNGLADLDSVQNFWTEGAKLILLNPRSSFEAECIRLKLDINDTQPAEFFYCNFCSHKFQSVSMYYDDVARCEKCPFISPLRRRVAKKESQAAVCDGGVFITNTASFIISDDLHLFPNALELLRTISILGITDTDGAELMNVNFGFSEIMELLKASLFSRTPLSDLILNKTRQMNSATVKSEPKRFLRQIEKEENSSLLHQTEKEENSNSKKMVLKVILQKSTNKLLFAKAEEDFIEFLFSFLIIPLGGVESLLASNTSLKSIDNLYTSIADLIDDKYLKTPDTKNRLIKPKLPHGCVPKNQILPLIEESLSQFYNEISWFSSIKFPKGQGNYVKGPRTYKVTDNLTVTPFCMSSMVSDIAGLKIPIYDVKELELHIGLEEALNILKASLTSTSALTNGLMNHILTTKARTPSLIPRFQSFHCLY